MRTGDEVMGLAAALLALGTRSLIAALVPVPDDASRALMLGLHRELRAVEAPLFRWLRRNAPCCRS